MSNSLYIFYRHTQCDIYLYIYINSTHLKENRLQKYNQIEGVPKNTGLKSIAKTIKTFLTKNKENKSKRKKKHKRNEIEMKRNTTNYFNPIKNF